ELIGKNKILSANTIKYGGIARCVSEMAFGNKIGFVFNEKIVLNEIFVPKHGSILIEIDENENVDALLSGINYEILGTTVDGEYIEVLKERIQLDELIE
ncbi:hypothetical protein, partial [Pyramidobacter sp. C12-8]